MSVIEEKRCVCVCLGGKVRVIPFKRALLCTFYVHVLCAHNACPRVIAWALLAINLHVRIIIKCMALFGARTCKKNKSMTKLHISFHPGMCVCVHMCVCVPYQSSVERS